MEDKILSASRYAAKDMDDIEIADFEARLKTDAQLKQYVADYTNLDQSLKIHLHPSSDDQSFKDTLASLNKKHFVPEAKVRSLKATYKWLSGVAAMLIMGLLIWVPWQGNLYDKYALNSEMMVTERGADAVTDLDRAASLYNQKKYLDAQPLLAKQYALQPKNALVGFYYGITLIETEQPVKARKILTEIYDGNSAFKYDAAYYIALSFLKEKNKVECKLWLQKIPSDTRLYPIAKQLMSDI